MATDPIIGPVTGPVNKKSDRDRNTLGKTAGGVPKTVARTRSAGPPTAGGNRPPMAAASTKGSPKTTKREEGSKDKIPIDVLRQKQTHRRGPGGA